MLRRAHTREERRREDSLSNSFGVFVYGWVSGDIWVPRENAYKDWSDAVPSLETVRSSKKGLEQIL